MSMPNELKFELYQASMEIVGLIEEIRALGVNDKQDRLLRAIDDKAIHVKELAENLS